MLNSANVKALRVDFAGVAGDNAPRVSLNDTSWLRAISRFDRNAYLLFITAGLLGFTYWGITYLLTNLYVLRLGYGTEVVGNLNFLFYLLVTVFSVPAGVLGIWTGSRRAMILGGILALAGWAIAPSAIFILAPRARIAALAVSRVISALGGALFIVNSNPALMGAVEPSSSTYAFAFNGTVISITTFVGSLFGGLLPSFFSVITRTSLSSSIPYGLALWAAVVILAPGLILLGFFRETGKGVPKTDRGTASPLPVALIAVIVVVRFLREYGYGGVLTFFNVYLDTSLRLPTSSIGFLVSIAAIASIVCTPLMPLVARRWGTGRTSLAGLIAMGIAIIPLALVRSWLPAAIGWAGMTAANSLNEAAMQVYILDIVATRWRSLMSGAANMASTLGLAASALGGGYLIRAAGFRALFLLSAVLLFASAASFAAHLRLHRQPGNTREAVPAR
ncbi:MAG TPA: MFS transporter [Spirochaetia bacterium]|nr:MFS transporter [Spirochaetia bacterium]